MNWANRITLFRIALAPVFLVLFALYQTFLSVWVLGALVFVFFVSELSDILDGWVARRFHLVSDLGKFLDPFSDVLSRLTIFLCLLIVGVAPLYAFALIFYREFSMVFLRLLMLQKGHVQGAATGGKIKAWFYFFASLSGLTEYSFQTLKITGFWDAPLHWATQIFFALSTLMALVSFAQYARTFWKLRKS